MISSNGVNRLGGGKGDPPPVIFLYLTIRFAANFVLNFQSDHV